MDLIKQTKEPGRLFINKLAAAERQVAAAIRMYFMEEDSLAIHTVASAALNLYADLLRIRGKDPALYGSIYGLFRAARNYLEGALSDEDLSKWGEDGLEGLQPFIDVLRANPDFEINEIKVSGPAQFIRDFWSDKRRAYNFLKHADRDSGDLLDEAIINNEDIIFQAIGNSMHLNCKFTPEKEFFFSALYAFRHLEDPPNEPVLIWILMAYSREETMHLARRNLCYSRIDDDLDIDFDSAWEQSKMLLDGHFKTMSLRRKAQQQPIPKP